MQQWEYRTGRAWVVHSPNIAEVRLSTSMLDEMGQQGWELVCATPVTADTTQDLVPGAPRPGP